MKILKVDCSKPIGQQEEVVEMTQAEINALPTYVVTWDDIRALQQKMISETDSMWRAARYQMQEFSGRLTSDTQEQYDLMEQYVEDIRKNDEGLHATPGLAIATLNNLTDPA